MLIDALKEFFLIDPKLAFHDSKNSFQKGSLRILLSLTVFIFAISELHGLIISNGLYFFSANTAYLAIFSALLFLSKKSTKASAVLFTLTLIISFLHLIISNDSYVQSYALVSLYSLPIITRLLFNLKVSIAVILLNIYPFYLVTNEQLLTSNLEAMSFFNYQLLVFITLNLSLTFAVSRILHILENNISVMRSLNIKLNTHYALHEEFFESTGTSTILCDKNGRILKANKLARKLLSIKNKKQLSNSLITDWIVPINKKNQALWESGITECTLKSNPNTYITSHRTYLAKHNYHALRLENTTQLKAIQEKLHNSQQTNSRLTHFDSLTRLPNLQNFCRQVNQIIEKNKHLTGVMFIVHLCQFKLLNKQYGKKSANKVILEFSNTLQKTLSEQAIIGRLHGVKFACFVQLNQTHLIKKNLTTFVQSILPSQIKLNKNILNMDYQIGVAYFHKDGNEAEILLDHCEMALENSSSSERISYYNNSLENKLIEEHKLGLKLSEAIKNKELDMWLQPQVSVKGEICSFEALARWQLDGQFISPLSFIKIAEDLGLLPILSENFLLSIVEILSEWHKESINIPIAFNLAGQELMNDSFFALLMTLINEKPWLSNLLELEITETSAVMTNPLIHERLRSLSQYGFSIAIDDFGTGQASLGQLVDIPANILKIDRRFISPLPNDQRHLDIVKSTIQLAESLNMKVVAEGIETKEQANLLIALGCHTLQGYYYGKPSPMKDWTSKNNKKAKELRMVY